MLAVEQTQNQPAAIKIFSTERIQVGVGGFSPAGWQIFATGAVSTIGKVGNHYCRIRKARRRRVSSIDPSQAICKGCLLVLKSWTNLLVFL